MATAEGPAVATAEISAVATAEAPGTSLGPARKSHSFGAPKLAWTTSLAGEYKTCLGLPDLLWITGVSPDYMGSLQINIAAARAVDREFEYNFWLKFGWREAGGLRLPAPPCILGLRPPDPPKGAPRPLL